MSIQINFVEAENSLRMEVPMNSTIRDTLLKYLKMINFSFDLSTDRITFMYKMHILNKEQNFDKKLSDLKIGNGAKIKVVKLC